MTQKVKIVRYFLTIELINEIFIYFITEFFQMILSMHSGERSFQSYYKYAFFKSLQVCNLIFCTFIAQQNEGIQQAKAALNSPSVWLECLTWPQIFTGRTTRFTDAIAANKRTNSQSFSLIFSSRKGFSDRNCGNFVLMMNIKDACSPRSWLKNSTKKHFNTMNTCLRCLSYRYWLHTIVRLAIKSTMY